jgi:hypothetical protein
MNIMWMKELKKNLKIILFKLIYIIIKNNYIYNNIWIYHLMKKKNIISLNKITSVIFAMNFFLKILNVKDALLFAALPASIAFILLITTAAPYAGINGLVF